MIALAAPFRWEDGQIRADLPEGHVMFTTRAGGVSEEPFDSFNMSWWKGDDLGAVARNYELLAQLTALDRERLLLTRQIHENAVHTVSNTLEVALEADALTSALPGTALIVLTADCLPILLLSTKAVSAVHAGWRGLASGVVENAIASLRTLDPDGQFTAVIGPSAGPCCYEVSEEVIDHFLGYDARRGERNLDLPGVAAAKLTECGIENIHHLPICTLCCPAGVFYSHRRDGEKTGRQAACVWRAS